MCNRPSQPDGIMQREAPGRTAMQAGDQPSTAYIMRGVMATIARSQERANALGVASMSENDGTP